MDLLIVQPRIGSKNYSWSQLCLFFIEIICFDDVIMGVNIQNCKVPNWLAINDINALLCTIADGVTSFVIM